MTVSEFYTAAEEYVALFDAFALKHALVGKVQADHICYKCDSLETYEQMRAMFEPEAQYLYQSIVSERRVAIVRLKNGIATSLGVINFVELSDRKPTETKPNRFDHIEAFPTAYSYDEMVAELGKTEEVILDERSHHTTHDIVIKDTFLFRCTHGPLIDLVKDGEMR
jgi:predicted metalloenzyme YecM